jgi:hypothetical protein
LTTLIPRKNWIRIIVDQLLREVGSDPQADLEEFKLRQYLNSWKKEFGDKK